MDTDQCNFTEALLQLRPKYATRLAKRAAIQPPDPHSYFLTIPRDIVHVILEFLPDLRQSYHTPEFAQEVLQITSKIQAFYEQYKPENPTEILPNTIPAIDKTKLQRDYPTIQRFIQNREILLKITDNGIIWKQNLYPLQQHLAYLGNDCVLFASAGIINQNERFLQLTYHNSDLQPIHLLPCGLLLCQSMQHQKQYLADPFTSKSVQINYVPINLFQLMDDFGKLLAMPPKIARACKYSCAFQSAYLF